MPVIHTVGSLNIDHVYRVPHFARAGESLPVQAYSRGAGGKGLNQSIAAARAEAQVRHIGCIGGDGFFLKDLLCKEGVEVSGVRETNEPTGHAVIQVDDTGENSIVLFYGANHAVAAEAVERALDTAQPGDILLLQNEISSMEAILRIGYNKKMRIILNTAPFSAELRELPLAGVDLLICNHTEGRMLSGESEPNAILQALVDRYRTTVILTLGSKGSRCLGEEEHWELAAHAVNAVDTTGAGDTFVGYLAAGMAQGQPIREAAQVATRAAAVCVTRQGASASIPEKVEVLGQE